PVVETTGVATNAAAGVTETTGAQAAAAAGVAEALAAPSLYHPASSAFVTETTHLIQAGPVGWPGATLLHGFVAGVPVRGDVPVDARPAAGDLRPALGHHGDDVVAALVEPGLGAASPDQRRALERLLSAFTGQLMPRLGSPDGIVDVEEHEHRAAFG